MENFTLQVNKVIDTYDYENYQMINIKITIINGKFPIRALEPFVLVRDDVNTLNSFMTRISGNQKEMNGFFTVDAFEIFPSNVDIEFGYGSEVSSTFGNFDITNAVNPLDPDPASSGVPVADNSWLSTITIA